MIFLYYLYLITSLVWGAPQSPAKTGYTPPQGYVLQASSSDTLSDPSTGNDSTARDGVFEWHFWAQCSDKKKNIVKQAWEDSKEFSDAWASWVPKGDFQQVVDMYMGLDSIKDKMRTRITGTSSDKLGPDLSCMSNIQITVCILGRPSTVTGETFLRCIST